MLISTHSFTHFRSDVAAAFSHAIHEQAVLPAIHLKIAVDSTHDLFIQPLVHFQLQQQVNSAASFQPVVLPDAWFGNCLVIYIRPTLDFQLPSYIVDDPLTYNT